MEKMKKILMRPILPAQGGLGQSRLEFGHLGGDAEGIRAAKPGVERSDTPGFRKRRGIDPEGIAEPCICDPFGIRLFCFASLSGGVATLNPRCLCFDGFAITVSPARSYGRHIISTCKCPNSRAMPKASPATQPCEYPENSSGVRVDGFQFFPGAVGVGARSRIHAMVLSARRSRVRMARRR